MLGWPDANRQSIAPIVEAMSPMVRRAYQNRLCSTLLDTEMGTPSMPMSAKSTQPSWKMITATGLNSLFLTAQVQAESSSCREVTTMIQTYKLLGLLDTFKQVKADLLDF
ncbi:hypothetical protein LCGC14_2501070, partial [marine sediment metagenome]